MRIVSPLLEVLGLGSVVVAAALVDYRLGLAVFGAVLVLVGMALDPPARRVE